MQITVENYRRTQTKHRKAKKGHGWTKLERIEMDCIWVNLKNVGPPFFKPFFSLYQNAIYPAGKSFSVVTVALILQMKESCFDTLTFRAHN